VFGRERKIFFYFLFNGWCLVRREKIERGKESRHMRKRKEEK